VSAPRLIRLAGECDLGALAAIYNQAIAARQTADTEPVAIDERRRWLLAHPADSHPVHVIEQSGCVIGYSSLSSYRGGRKALRYTVEISFFVDHAHLGRGVGAALVDHAMASAAALGYRTLVALLLGNNAPSIGILEKYGFREWGRLPGAADFDGVEVDHLLYGRRLDGLHAGGGA
jgi:phosphinothricin acetyltransferase